MEDQTLLQRFTDSGSEEAFRTLVARHLSMVLAVAERRTGSGSLAQDIAQSVFATLARKAHQLKARPGLTGWLYRTTLNECAQAHRRNHAHARKMNEFSQHLLNNAAGRNVWQEALPLLDDAIDKLPSADRELILLRFFERKSFRQIAESIGKTETAAQKQGERALQKLGDTLRRKGVTISGTILASGLAAQAIPTISDQLIETIAMSALDGATQLTAKISLLEALKAMNPLQTKTAVAIAVAAAIPLALQWNSNQALRAQISELQNQSPKTATESAKPQRPSSAVARPRIERAKPDLAPAIQLQPNAPNTTPDTWARALFEPDPVRRTQRIAQLLASLTAEQAPQVASSFQLARKGGNRFAEEYRLFLRAWGKLDGAAAMNHLVPSPEFTRHSPEMLAALAGWATTNPRGALSWIEALPEKSPRENLIFGLLDGWSMVDFAGAAAYAETRPRSTARNQFRQLLLERSLASNGIAGAQQWFNQISNNDHNSLYKQMAFDEVIQAMLYRDPSAAAHWIAQMGGQKFVTSKPVLKTASALAESNPAQAMHWLQTLGHLETKDAVAGKGRVLTQWAAKDPGAAGTWLTQQRSDGQYDSLAATFANAIARMDPPTALAWAQSVGDEKFRELAERQVAAQILKTKNAQDQLLAAGYSQQFIDLAKAEAKKTVTGNINGAQYLNSGFAAFSDAEGSLQLINGLQTEDLYFTSNFKNNGGAKNPHGNIYQGIACTQCHQNNLATEQQILVERRQVDRLGDRTNGNPERWYQR